MGKASPPIVVRRLGFGLAVARLPERPSVEPTYHAGHIGFQQLVVCYVEPKILFILVPGTELRAQASQHGGLSETY